MRKNPFREIERMIEQMSRQFEESTRQFEESPIQLGAGGSMNVDLEARDDEYVVTADLPGFDKDDIDVEIADTRLRIRAEHEEESERDEENYIRRERSNRSMSRSISLPEPVTEDEVSATYRNGVLTVTLPRAEPGEGGKQIDIT
ncbi:MAG: archaeal heat shock protein Hsp14 [Salinigranum sp.]